MGLLGDTGVPLRTPVNGSWAVSVSAKFFYYYFIEILVAAPRKIQGMTSHGPQNPIKSLLESGVAKYFRLT